jgi:hypothetical protein
MVRAARLGRLETVRVLLEGGAGVDETSEEGETPLLAALRWGYPDLIPILLEAGADVDISDRDGITPLIEAAGTAGSATIEMLLDAGAEADAEDDDGETPVSRALWGNRIEVLELLRNAGAHVPDAEVAPVYIHPIHGWSVVQLPGWRMAEDELGRLVLELEGTDAFCRIDSSDDLGEQALDSFETSVWAINPPLQGFVDLARPVPVLVERIRLNGSVHAVNALLNGPSSFDRLVFARAGQEGYLIDCGVRGSTEWLDVRDADRIIRSFTLPGF